MRQPNSSSQEAECLAQAGKEKRSSSRIWVASAHQTKQLQHFRAIQGCFTALGEAADAKHNMILSQHHEALASRHVVDNGRSKTSSKLIAV